MITQIEIIDRSKKDRDRDIIVSKLVELNGAWVSVQEGGGTLQIFINENPHDY